MEIGCGSGYVICSAALMLRQAAPSCSFAAVDVSADAIAATSQTLAAHGVEGVRLVQSDLLENCNDLCGGIDLLVSCAKGRSDSCSNAFFCNESAA